MCFSATASFIASGALAASGVAIARMPKSRSAIPLSLAPVIFATHQFIEGLLWLNHRGVLADGVKTVGVYGFLLIAYVLWPIFVPFAAHATESGRVRRWIMLLCLLVGLYAGMAALVGIIRAPVDASVVGHSFAYVIDLPRIFFTPYVIAVAIPFLVSSNKRLALFGVALAASCVAAMFIASAPTFPSVWCFYAAILSLLLYLFFRYSAKQHLKMPAVDTAAG
jgi:hypothetical protein